MSEEKEVVGFRPLGEVKSPETPKVETPPIQGEAPKPGEAPVVEPQFDLKQFGDFSSPDELKSFIESSRSAVERATQYESEIKSLKSQPIYADESLYKLDFVKRNNPDKFGIAKDLLFGNISDLDAVRMGLEYEEPVFQTMDEQTKQAYLDRKYNLSSNLSPLKPEDGYSEEEIRQRDKEISAEESRIRAEKAMLAMDAARARKKLEDTLFNGVQIPKNETPEEAKKRQDETIAKLARQWEEPMKKVLDYKSISIESWNPKEGKNQSVFDMEMSDQDRQKYVQELNSHIVQNGWTPENISVDDAKAFIRNRWVEDNFSRIIHEASVRARNMSNEDWQKFFFNPERPASPSNVPVGKGPARSTTDSFQRAMGKM